MFERALLRRGEDSPPAELADLRFDLAQALWASGGDRALALALARNAAATHDDPSRPRLPEIATWLASHAP